MKSIVASTLDLWADLKRKGWGHICNLNQDILELFFIVLVVPVTIPGPTILAQGSEY